MFQADDEEWQLSAASDSDLAGCLNTSRSTSGCYSKLGKSGAVMCSSSLEKKISTSTGQAETYAMQSLVKEVVWERHLLNELRFPQPKPTLALTDNDGVLKQSTKAINHSTAKHYRIAQAYIRSILWCKIKRSRWIESTQQRTRLIFPPKPYMLLLSVVTARRSWALNLLACRELQPASCLFCDAYQGVLASLSLQVACVHSSCKRNVYLVTGSILTIVSAMCIQSPSST